jgi:hypothetical protein
LWEEFLSVSDLHYVYILSEDDNDDHFYEGCLNKITGICHEVVPLRLRKNGGISEVRKKLPILLKTIQYSGHVENAWFLVALDNDRSPIHPDHTKPADFSKLPRDDQTKTCRYCDLERVVTEKLGTDRQQWPIKGVIAVPVQMLETWLLLIANPIKHNDEKSLPMFAEKGKPSTRDYYKSNPPPQLKDLKEVEKQRLEIESNGEFCKYCADQLNPVDLRQRSPSFKQFMDEINAWN